MQPRTLVDRIWDAHVVRRFADGRELLYIDRHVLHEITSPEAFRRLDDEGWTVRRPDRSLAVQDHIVSTRPGRDGDSYPGGAPFVTALRANARRHGIRLFDLGDPRQGIVHVVAAEQGLALPGTTVVCGDSHTCTLGALGALAFGIGSSEAAHVLATQTLVMRRPRPFRLTVTGGLGPGVSAKDLILYAIGRLGAGAGAGHAVELAGPAVAALPVEARFTLCNMAIEMGARIGVVAPDAAVLDYLRGRPEAPAGPAWDASVAAWATLASDPGAVFDRDEVLDADGIAPQVTWGTSPEHVAPVTGVVPDPAAADTAARRRDREAALAYMGLAPGTPLAGLKVDVAFIGSCTNARLSDLREAAAVLRGRRVAAGVRALVVPGSSAVKRAAEAEGLDRVFAQAGFAWRESGCSACCGLNDDMIGPGERCLSSSNRNFEGRQGTGARTHLASPAMVAAGAVAGHIADVREIAG